MPKKLQPAKAERALTAVSSANSGTWNAHGVLNSHGRPLRFSDIGSFFGSTSNLRQFLSSITKSRTELAVLVEFLDARACLNLQRRFLRSVWVRSNVVVTYSRKRKRAISNTDDCPHSGMRKRCFLLDLNEEENENQNQIVMTVPGGVQNDLERLSSVSLILEKPMSTPIMSDVTPSSEAMGCRKREFGQRNDELEVGCSREGLHYLHEITSGQSDLAFQDKFPHSLETILEEDMMESALHPNVPVIYNSELGKAEEPDGVNNTVTRDLSDSIMLEVDNQMRVSRPEVGVFSQSFVSLAEDVNEKSKDVYNYDFFRLNCHFENRQINTTLAEEPQFDNHEKNFVEHLDLILIPADSETACNFQIQGSILTQFEGSSTSHNDEAIAREKICPTISNPHPGSQKVEDDKKLIHVKQKLKGLQNMNSKQNRETQMVKSKKTSSNDSRKQPYPKFECFDVEDEEGSGGYGTVYRAKRKADGVTVAIKCPHANANRSHLQNELKMLKQLGGKNFVIKYEGSFKHENADCLVLEHIEHDRPEVLKREIDIFQLQWYGYCLFQALANLHRQGIVHRDVKPGNFLYSCKTNKGYLIDFNLALDYRKKYLAIDGVQADARQKYDHIPISHAKSSEKNKKSTTKFPATSHKNTGQIMKPLLPTGDLQKKADKANALMKNTGKDMTKSQGAEGSGVTSAKETAKIRSGGKFREPLPSQGRKELLNLAKEALHGINHEHLRVSANTSKRKRVEAPRGDLFNKFFYPTPMPLHANRSAVACVGSLKCDGKKQRREGPCVGTKGFKAPEVLFRSLHQGHKVDIWSAGVTLLYLILGRTPFAGDTDQNIKEIARLRGSEDLWEVAKLHNQESSFPLDLFDMKYLPPIKLGDWCAVNTRRPDFLKAIPKSLFDLLDKCLTVNPRCRISAEEALRHEFFVPCLETVRKHKLHRETRLGQ